MPNLNRLYGNVMDPQKNPLGRLPKAQRFQIMVILAFMWSVFFSVGIGTWAWFGELVVMHTLVLVGILVTGWTFQNAGSFTLRDRSGGPKELPATTTSVVGSKP